MYADLQNTVPKTAPLGQKSPYPKAYDKSLLEPIARAMQRSAMKLPDIKFYGFDVWNAYELFWLNHKGKPVRAFASISVPSSSPFLCESKSVKLYLNSLNHERFETADEVLALIKNDLSEKCQANVDVIFAPKDLASFDAQSDKEFICLDDLDIEITTYNRSPELIRTSDEIGSLKAVSHLFKSHCLCTGQPDLGSIFIDYRGPRLDEKSLLAYLVSYRDHIGFSENCIEQIYADIFARTTPEKLTVFGRFTRRGGIDINPYRSSHELAFHNARLIYQ